MKFNLDKKSYNEFLSLTQCKYDAVYLILYSIIYFYITYYALAYNFKTVLLYYVISIILLYIVISLIKKIFRIINIKSIDKKYNIFGDYNISLDKNKIIETINNKTYEYEIENIRKIKYNRNYIIIKFKNKELLVFIKKIMKEKDYLEIKSFLNNIK